MLQAIRSWLTKQSKPSEEGKWTPGSLESLQKPDLQEFCELANEIGKQIDPEQYIEDRNEVIGEKLRDSEIRLHNPSLTVQSGSVQSRQAANGTNL